MSTSVDYQIKMPIYCLQAVSAFPKPKISTSLFRSVLSCRKGDEENLDNGTKVSFHTLQKTDYRLQLI
jgi:hypothetical protein